MRILQLNPIEINNFIMHCDNIKRNGIMVGKGKDDFYYLADLTFKPVLINYNEILVKAVLKMHCKKTYGSRDCINICINNDNINANVNGEGDYEWDVTSLVKRCNDKNFKLSVYPKMWISHCSVKEFETINYGTMPVLEVIIDNELTNTDNIVNAFNEYTSTNKLRHSDWIDCISLNKYYYFVENLGDSDVEVSIEISPDKKVKFQDSECLVIRSNSVMYLQSMRDSRYIRLSYENLSSNISCLIKVWFQGKK